MLSLGESSMAEPNLAQPVLAHEPALVHISVDSVESAFTCVLPYHEVQVVLEHRFILRILGNHDLVVAEQSQEIVVVEVGARIDEGFLLVFLLHQSQEDEERVDELFLSEATARLNVYHGQQVLVFGPTLCAEVLQLRLLWNARPIEMIGAHLESISMSQVNILLVFAVYTVASLGGFQIDVRHV